MAVDLRSELGVVFEEAFLFSDTIRANIAYGRPGASEAEVLAAARAAQVHTFVQGLPDGYDTLVGERGLTLSGGQRQRVALARALVSHPGLLLLDEPLGALDALTRLTMQNLIRDMHDRAGFTAVLVTHDVAEAVALSDRIIVLGQGGILNETEILRVGPVTRGSAELAAIEAEILDAIFAA